MDYLKSVIVLNDTVIRGRGQENQSVNAPYSHLYLYNPFQCVQNYKTDFCCKISFNMSICLNLSSWTLWKFRAGTVRHLLFSPA